MNSTSQDEKPNPPGVATGNQIIQWVDAHNNVHYSVTFQSGDQKATQFRALEIKQLDGENIDQVTRYMIERRPLIP